MLLTYDANGVYCELMTYVANDKEVKDMPGRDETDPMGDGSMTGRGFGPYSRTKTVKYGVGLGMGLGLGLACRRGFDRGFGRALRQSE